MSLSILFKACGQILFSTKDRKEIQFAKNIKKSVS